MYLGTHVFLWACTLQVYINLGKRTHLRYQPIYVQAALHIHEGTKSSVLGTNKDKQGPDLDPLRHSLRK